MTAHETLSGVRGHESRGPHCYICGEQLGPASDAAAAGELCTECRAAAADAQSHGDEFVVNHCHSLLDDPMRPALTGGGWEGLVIDSLVDAGLAITYGLQRATSDRGTPTVDFIDLFFQKFEEAARQRVAEVRVRLGAPADLSGPRES